MGAVLLSPVYILLNIYLAVRIQYWFAVLHPILDSLWFTVLFSILYAFAALTPLAAAFYHGKFKAWAKRTSNYWLGILMYLLLCVLFIDLARILVRLLQHRNAFQPSDAFEYRVTIGSAIAAAVALSLYGIRHASKIKITRYEVAIPKACPVPELKIALAADLHLGYNTKLLHIQKIRNAISGIHPDLVVYAGDIFDNEFNAVPKPKKAAALFASIKTTYGSFACWGNHDIEEVILAGFTFDSQEHAASCDPRMVQFLKKAEIRLLEDETVLIENAFYLSGRLDASCKEKSGTTRLTPAELLLGLDRSKPLIVLDHQPSSLPELSEAGADLVLSGHTHDGQIFPGNLTTRIGWLNSYGKLVLGSMTSIVTSGAGIWGPAMRVGTSSEIAEIIVKFSPPR